jgi:hypothetical protein
MFMWKPGMRASLMTWALVCAWATAGAARQEVPNVQRPTEPVVLAATAYTSDQGPRSVTVWRRDLDSPSSAVLQYLTRHPDRNALPNVVLYAIDSPLGSTAGGRVVWVGYDHFASNSRPWPTWSAGVTVHPGTTRIYLGVMKAISLHATLSLFEIARDASIAPYPPNFSVADVEQWPAAPGPVATFQKDSDDVCTATSMGMVATSTGLLMSVLREPGRCSSMYLEYDAGSKALREVTVAPPR